MAVSLDLGQAFPKRLQGVLSGMVKALVAMLQVTKLEVFEILVLRLIC